MMRVLPGLLGVLTVLGLVACNTVEGAGKDVKTGGEVISDTASTTKQRM